jgi:hypothetical protein
MTTHTNSSLLDARLRSVQARGRIADVLSGVALDVIEPFATDYLSADEYDHLCSLVQGPVRAVTEVALRSMETELTALVDSDEPVARRLLLTHGRRC